MSVYWDPPLYNPPKQNQEQQVPGSWVAESSSWVGYCARSLWKTVVLMHGRFGCAESWTWVGQFASRTFTFASGVNGSSWLRLLVVPVNWEYCVGMVGPSGMPFVSPEDQPTWAILQFLLRGTQHHEASICLRTFSIFPCWL